MRFGDRNYEVKRESFFAFLDKLENARQEQALASYEETVLAYFEEVENALVGYCKEQVRRRWLEAAVKSSQGSPSFA